VLAVHPDAEMYWTEGGPDYTAPDYETDWVKWSNTFTGVLRNYGRCIIAWNLVLDEVGKPNIGPFPCGGVVTVNSQTKKITRSGQYWAFAHYSRAVRQGATRIESSGDITGVSHVAFSNPDGGNVAVITNSGETRKIALADGSKSMVVELRPKSVTTLTWR
jgi:glucosylceramidase